TRHGVRVLPMPGPFNYADLNNRAIAQASGDIIGLVNNDIEALHEGWLDEIVVQLLQPNVGAVGAKLLWPNGMVQHGGVLL
ncbi:glycosyltransferase, partial [Acinetobacter baumannii]|nr:glycosyltransferase [Acinetobacter baumannii]